MMEREQMAAITVRNLRDDLGFGAIVEGLSWDNINDPAVRAQINDIFEDRGMIVFEGVEPSQKMHVAVSNIFGPLKDHPTKSTARVDQNSAPGVIDMHSMPREVGEDKRGLIEIDGTILGRFSPWHFDHCYNDELNRAGVLRCVKNSPVGGRTGFADGVEIYKDFDPALREKIEDLNVIYTLDTRLSQMRFGRTFKDFGDSPDHLATVKEAQIFPRAMHPAVWTRRTGEKVMHIGPWMSVGVEHHEDEAGEALFEEVCQELNRQANATAYWHDWKPTDMVIWDNWRMLHAVEGCDPKYERQTQRTTIKGDYGLGYFEDGKKIGEVFRELVM
jgi:taurine dioxygenase